MVERLVEAALRGRVLVAIPTLLVERSGASPSATFRSTRCRTSPTSRSRSSPAPPRLGPVEVERYVTFPVEAAMSGLAGHRGDPLGVALRPLRRDRRFQRRGEHLLRAPARLGAPAGGARDDPAGLRHRRSWARSRTGLGEVYQFVVARAATRRCSSKEILDWHIAYRLRSVPGVIEVTGDGG